MSLLSVINRVLSEIKPSIEEHERLNNIAKRIIQTLNKAFQDEGLIVEVVVGGSFSRRTYLKGSHDIDLFIRFKQENDLKHFNRIILNAFPEAELVKGSRDYFKVFVNSVEVQFIPTLKINNPLMALNSMDASYFHINYLNSKLNDNLRNEVLLLKQFLKSIGVYGAESHIKGFSGYVCELLIIRFGSFNKLINFMEEAGNSMMIDLESYYDSPVKAIKALRVNQLINPLIIVDPVFPTRNAAAGLSAHSWHKFILNSRLLIRKPSVNFFKIKKRLLDDVKSLAVDRGHHLYSKKFIINTKKDVFLAQLLSKLDKIKRLIEKEGFTVYDYGITSDNFVFFELEQSSLPISKRVIGPPVTVNSKNFDSFINKESINGPYVLDGRVCFDVKRKHTSAKQLINELLKDV